MNRCELCQERTDTIGFCYNHACENYRGKHLDAPSQLLMNLPGILDRTTEPSIQSKVSLADLRQANLVRQAEWCPDPNEQPDMSFRAIELAGETGEACNVVKKLERERHGWRGSRDSKEHLAEELADVVISADLLAITAGIDLQSAVVAKFNATSDKQGLKSKLGVAADLPPIKLDFDNPWPVNSAESILEERWQALMSVILECSPIPACKRDDDQLEPPEEVVRRIKSERDQAREALYMPGDWKCDKCKFVQHNRTLHALDMSISARTDETRMQCPNDGEDMRRVTWQESNEENYQFGIKTMQENDMLKEQLEEARKARDVAEAKGRWLEGVKACQSVSELVSKLPPDILMAPMPYPDRLDYAAKMIQEHVSNFLKEKFEVVARDAVDLTPANQWLSVGQLRQWLRTVLNP